MSGADTVCVIVASRLSSLLSTSSATAVTVTVCAVFQLLLLKVSLAGEIDMTPLPPDGVMTTSFFFPCGSLSRTTV